MIIKRLSHRYITIEGLENVPKNAPVIIAPNHQNALYDSLTIVLNSFFKPVFLARADIFKKKIIHHILNFMGMTPVYRIRDGKDTLDKNVAVFDNCVRILKNNRMLCIYPEAAHSHIKSMIPHKKAIPRIVFMAGESTNFDIDVKIIPVGINYSHYYNFRRSITIHFGEPISSKKYYKIVHDEGESKASNLLRNDLFHAIEKLVVHVPEKKYYDLYEQSFELMKTAAYEKLGLKKSMKYFYNAEKYLTQKLADKLESDSEIKDVWNAKAKEYKKLKNILNLNENELSKGALKFPEFLQIFFISILLVPLSVYGAISAGWFFYLTNYSFRKKVKDILFFSTFSFALNFLLYPIWIIIHYIILNSIFENSLIAIGLIIFSFPSGIIAWELAQLIKRTAKRLRMNRYIANANKQFQQLSLLRNELISFYQSIIN